MAAPDQPASQPDRAHPSDIAIGYRDGDIVARNLSGSPAGDHLLDRLGFAGNPGTVLRTLAADGDARNRRQLASAAIRLLRAAGFQVSADHGLDPGLDDAAQLPQAQPEAKEPDVAFARHPNLGICAATRDDTHGIAAVLAEHGFIHQPEPDIYVLPPALPDRFALLTTIRAARHLDNLGHTVTLDPKVYASVVIKVTARAPEMRPPDNAPDLPSRRPPEPPSPAGPRPQHR